MAGRRSVTAARWISPLVVDGSGDAAVRIGGTEGCCSGSREPPPRGTISTSLGRRAGARGAGAGRCSPCPSPMSCWWAVSHTWHGHFRPRNRPEHAGHRPRLVGWCAASSARQLATVHRSWLRAVDADTAPPTWTAMSSSAVSRSSTARREARSTPVTSSGLVCSTRLPRSSYSISPIHHSRYCAASRCCVGHGTSAGVGCRLVELSAAWLRAWLSCSGCMWTCSGSCPPRVEATTDHPVHPRSPASAVGMSGCRSSHSLRSAVSATTCQRS